MSEPIISLTSSDEEENQEPPPKRKRSSPIISPQVTLTLVKKPKKKEHPIETVTLDSDDENEESPARESETTNPNNENDKNSSLSTRKMDLITLSDDEAEVNDLLDAILGTDSVEIVTIPEKNGSDETVSIIDSDSDDESTETLVECLSPKPKETSDNDAVEDIVETVDKESDCVKADESKSGEALTDIDNETTETRTSGINEQKGSGETNNSGSHEVGHCCIVLESVENSEVIDNEPLNKDNIANSRKTVQSLNSSSIEISSELKDDKSLEINVNKGCDESTKDKSLEISLVNSVEEGTTKESQKENKSDEAELSNESQLNKSLQSSETETEPSTSQEGENLVTISKVVSVVELEKNEHSKLILKSHKNRVVEVSLCRPETSNDSIVIDDSDEETEKENHCENGEIEPFPVNIDKTITEELPGSSEDFQSESMETRTAMKKFLKIVEEKIIDSSFEELPKKLPLIKKYFKRSGSCIDEKAFQRLLNENTDSIRKAPNSNAANTAVLAFHRILAHLKCHVAETSIEIEEDHLPKVKKLEKTMMLLRNKIKQLEEAEVDFDDDGDSAYIMLDRYQARLNKIYARYCQYIHRNPYSGRPVYDRISFVNSKYNEINQAITRKYKNSVNFPSYYELENYITKTVKKEKLDLSDQEIKYESKKCFKYLGSILQKKRRQELYDSHLDFIEFTEDPATKDLSLENILRKNYSEGKEKVEKLLQKYVKKQEQGEDHISSDGGESSESSESKENNKKISKNKRSKKKSGKEITKSKTSEKSDEKSDEEAKVGSESPVKNCEVAVIRVDEVSKETPSEGLNQT